ncbi:helix-turn-helix domain-containing protein [Polaribacter marinaquae]|uniref:Helix-turn-helix domain-containing protein n=1 Tax=Polaribacter marinaquae TaxID=1642819 RepID=A0ABZ2TWA7_9FLAO
MKIVLYITSFLLFLGSFNTIAQNSKKFENYTFDELSDKYYEYKFTDSIKAKKFANFYFNKAVKEKDIVNAISGKYYLREVHKNDSIYIDYLDSIINISKSNPTKMFPALAYYQKTFFYYNNEKTNECLKNCLLGFKYLKQNKNDSLKYLFQIKLASIKTLTRKINESNKILLEIIDENNLKHNIINSENYFITLFNISRNYLKLKINDSSRYYNKKALQFSKSIKDSLLIGYSLNNQGLIHYYEKEYLKSIKYYSKSLPYLIEDENYRAIFDAYNLIAKSYIKLNKTKKALKYNLLIDSLYQKQKITFYAQKNSYSFLIKYYKNNQDIKNQLKYINKYLKVDSILNVRNKNLSKTFTEEYDRPKLIAEKQKIISELNNEVSFYKKSRIYIAIVLILSFILFLYQFRKRKKQEQKFDNLTIKLKNKKVVENSVNSNTNTQKNLSETIITELLAKLDSFEQQPENFTNNKLTLSILAKELETNSNYLSKVINQKKGCNFSTYLRKLRIDYALDLLEKDATIRKFSIDAIAKEVGFKNAETFSKAFFKETELNPSFYIKQLEKKG